MTAEFRETRSELTRVLTKKTAVLRSSAATFEVSPRLQILNWEQQLKKLPPNVMAESAPCCAVYFVGEYVQLLQRT